MTIAIFANPLRSETLRELKRVLEYMQQRDVKVVLSHEYIKNLLDETMLQ